MKQADESLQGWLDDEFSTVDAGGVYQAHQPIYGFRQGHCAGMVMMRYTITYQILRALARLKFKTFIDIGGAEGYKSALVKKIFQADVFSCDFSHAANQRALEIFQVAGQSVDVRDLPFADGAFDVVVCSETLEHIKDIQRATQELLRVARSAVIITVPQDPAERIARNLKNSTDPFPHIQCLDSSSFDWVKELGWHVQAKVFNSKLLSLFFKVAEAADVTKPKYSALRKFLQNRILNPMLREMFGRGFTARLMELDDRLAGKNAVGKNLIFVLVKDPAAITSIPRLTITAKQVLDFCVPLHFLGNP